MVFDSQPLPLKRPSSSGVLCGWMKISTPSSSAFAQKGWNIGSENSLPATLAPTAAPRSPSFFTPCTNCSTARSGCCSATEANATKRSGYSPHHSASFSFCTRITSAARSRGARYHSGLIDSASMSMPCSSISAMRREPTSPMPGPRWSSSFSFSRSSAPVTTQCACTSMVFTRLPPTSTWRRRPPAVCAAVLVMLQPVNTMPSSQQCRV